MATWQVRTELPGSWATWPRGYMADLISFSSKDVGIFNTGLWRIGTDCAIFRLLRLPYKLQLLCNGAHALNLLSFLGRNWNPRMMKRQGLVVIAGGLPGDPELVFGSDGPLLVGVVFFPSSSLMRVMLFPIFVR